LTDRDVGAQLGGHPAAAVGHVHQGIVVRAQCQPNVQWSSRRRDETTPSHRHPPAPRRVASGLRTISAGSAEKDPLTKRATANIQPRIQIDDDVEEMRVVIRRRPARAGQCHVSWPFDGWEISKQFFVGPRSVEMPDWAQSSRQVEENRSRAIRIVLELELG